MKKLLLMFAAVAAIAFVGCKTETKPAEAEVINDSIEAPTTEYTVESVTTDLMKFVEAGDEAGTLGFLDGLKKTADEFMNAGENDKYFNIINIIKTVWDQNKDAIMAKLPNIADKMSNYINVPDNMKEGFNAFVANATQNIADKANEAGEKVADKADQAADKAGEVVNDTKQAAGDALKKAGEELQK